jgi:FHA domain
MMSSTLSRVRRIYLFAVLGASGGLIAAALHQWIILPARARATGEWREWVLELLLGAFIGAPIGFLPRLSEAWGRCTPRDAFRAAALAAALAAAGGMVAVPGGERLHQALGGGYLGRACSVGFLGLALGTAEAISGGARRWRGILGGIAGGVVAGLILEWLVRALEPSPGSAIVALIVLGISISLGVALFVHVAADVWLEGLYGSKVYHHVYHLTRYREPNEAIVGSGTGVFLWLANIEPRHASLSVTPQGVRLKHIGKAGETYVNGSAVRECLLKDGDVIAFSIAFSDARLRFCERRARGAAALHRVKLVGSTAGAGGK